MVIFLYYLCMEWSFSFYSFAVNNGADQPAHQHNLISTIFAALTVWKIKLLHKYIWKFCMIVAEHDETE